MTGNIENPLNVTSEPDQPQPQDFLSDGVMDLLGAMVSQNARDAAYTSNTLINGYMESAETAEATLHAIRFAFEAAMDGDYMPTPGRLMAILYPSPEIVDRFRRDRGGKR